MNDKYEIINNIKKQLSIIDVISTFVKLLKKGNNYVGICPFHNDNHPSLVVNQQKNIFKCFSCNVSGDVISFIAKIKHLNYYQSIFWLCEQYNIDINKYELLKKELNISNENMILYEINLKANEYFSNFLHNKKNQAARDYLKIRNINQELIDYFHIGFVPDDKTIMINLLNNKDNILMSEELGYRLKDIDATGLSFISPQGDHCCLFQNRIIIPIYNINQQIIAFGGRSIDSNESKYINTPTTKIFNKAEVLFNLNNILNNNADIEELYLVEGYMDVISLHKIGIKNVVATMGVAFSKKHLELLKILNNLKVINICYDNDEAGKRATLSTANIIKEKYLVSILNYESNYKDMDEIINVDIELAKKQILQLIDLTSFKINQLIANKNLNDQNTRRIIFNDSLKILNQEKDLVSINDNILKLCNILNIERDLLFSKLKLKSKERKYINHDAKIDVEFEDYKKINPKKHFLTEGTENEILVCIFANRECLTIFENKCNVFLDNDYQEIFNLIQEYYYLHPDKDKITIDDIKIIFKNSSATIIAKATTIALKKEEYSLKTLQERIAKTLERHLQLLKQERHKRIIEQMQKANDKQTTTSLLKKIIND